jgi:excisionase family DNA binding protein
MGMETYHIQPGEAETLTSDRRKPVPAIVERRMIMRAYMTIEEVARSLRVSVPTVRWLRQEGRFAPAIKIGRRVVWDEAEVLAWIERNRESAGAV